MWFPMSIFFTRRLHQKNTGGSFSCSWDSQNSLFRIEEEWRTKTITFARGWECRATTRWLQDVASICRFSITYLEWSCDRLLFFFWGGSPPKKCGVTYRDGSGAATLWSSATWAKMFPTEKRLGTLCRRVLHQRIPTFIRLPVLRA